MAQTSQRGPPPLSMDQPSIPLAHHQVVLAAGRWAACWGGRSEGKGASLGGTEHFSPQSSSLGGISVWSVSHSDTEVPEWVVLPLPHYGLPSKLTKN